MRSLPTGCIAILALAVSSPCSLYKRLATRFTRCLLSNIDHGLSLASIVTIFCHDYTTLWLVGIERTILLLPAVVMTRTPFALYQRWLLQLAGEDIPGALLVEADRFFERLDRGSILVEVIYDSSSSVRCVCRGVGCTSQRDAAPCTTRSLLFLCGRYLFALPSGRYRARQKGQVYL